MCRQCEMYLIALWSFIPSTLRIVWSIANYCAEQFEVMVMRVGLRLILQLCPTDMPPLGFIPIVLIVHLPFKFGRTSPSTFRLIAKCVCVVVRTSNNWWTGMSAWISGVVIIISRTCILTFVRNVFIRLTVVANYQHFIIKLLKYFDRKSSTPSSPIIVNFLFSVVTWQMQSLAVT